MSFNVKKYVVLIFTVIIIYTLIYASAIKPEFKIGVVLPLSGSMSFHGQQILAGMNIALNTLKLKDEDLYSRIKLIVKDDKSLTSTLVSLTDELVNKDKVNIIVGSLPLSTTLALAKIVSSYKKIFISPVISSETIVQVGDGIYQTVFSPSYEGKLLAVFALDNLKKNKAIILVDSSSETSKFVAKNFETVFSKNGGQIIKKFNYTFNEKELKKILMEIKALKPQLVILPAYYNIISEVLNIATEMGITATFLGNSDWDSPFLYEKTNKKALKNSYYVTHYNFDIKDELVQNFVQEYQKTYKTSPSIFAAMGYDSMLLITQACKNANSTLNSTLINAFSKLKAAKTLMGKAFMLPSGEIEKTGVILKTTPNGPQFETTVEYVTVN